MAQEDEYQIKVARLNELNFLLSKKDDQPQLGLEQPQPEQMCIRDRCIRL